MKLKLFLGFALSALLLSSCGGNSSSQASVESNEKEESSSNALDGSEKDGFVESSFEVSSIDEPRHNDEAYDYSALKLPVQSGGISDEFAFGADLSTVAEVERLGGVYYNEEGVEEDVFQILAKDGVNYCRLRLWNDPKSSLTGLPYGGGDNDIETDIALARRAKAAGMKLLLDFHYSDSWADPQKQWLPKAWKELLAFEYPDAIEEFTKNSLQAFKDAGIRVDAVQIGNETNNKIIEVSTSDGEFLSDLISSGVNGVKSVFPNAKTLVHLTNIKSPKGVYNFLERVKEVPYDIVGLSYYPFWHGSMDNLLNVMNYIEKTYSKPVWVVETSYGFTDEVNPNVSNTYHSSTFETPGGYLTGWQGQATMVADVVNTLSKVNNNAGQGVFWWEPAWLPVEGTTWASKAGQFYNDNGRDGSEAEIASYTDQSCLAAWANQGWFSYSGKALPSASMYRHIKDRDIEIEEREQEIREAEIEVTVNLIDGISLPSTAAVVTNLDALRQSPVTWNEEETQAILEEGDGEYVVHGKVGEFDISAKVTAETNYIRDYSFENQANAEEAEVKEPWVATCTTKKGVWIEAKSAGNLDGEKYFHWYNVNDFSFTLQQTLTDVRAGDYDLSTRIMAGASADFYTKFDLWYQIQGQEKVAVDVLDDVVKGWGAPLSRYMQRGVIEHILIPDDGTTIAIGMTVEVVGSGWGHNDLWSFAKHKEAVVEEEYVANGGLEDGGFQSQTLWTLPGDPWVITDAGGGFEVGNTEPMKKESANYVHWYNSASFKVGFHQNIKNLEPGFYSFSYNILSADASFYDYFRFIYQVEGEDPVTIDASSFCQGWHDSDDASTVSAIVEGIEAKANKKIAIGIEFSAKAEAWGRMTDLKLTRAEL